MSEVIVSQTLYAKDARGDVRFWTIEATEDATLDYTYGMVGGQPQYKTEQIELNQSGRDIDEQMLLQFKSKIAKMKDKGYVDSYELAKGMPRTNLLNLPRPMLAQDIDKVKNIDFTNAFVQRKYDGNRCLIANVAGEIIAYSRNGKRVESIDHITESIGIPEGLILDGELYAHGESLQTIVSWIKRKQPETRNLRYHAYDVAFPAPFKYRLKFLNGEIGFGEYAIAVETTQISSLDEALEFFQIFRKDNYEGAILRWGSNGYEDSKRSRSLVKIKEWHDAEFKVTSITPSKDGWAILVCELPDGNTFRVSAPGSIEEKEYCYKQKDMYIGRYVTVEYAYLTKDGIPFHPIAKIWRA